MRSFSNLERLFLIRKLLVDSQLNVHFFVASPIYAMDNFLKEMRGKFNRKREK